MGDPCRSEGRSGCPLGGCFLNNFTEEERNDIYSTYWNIKTYEQKAQYLLGCLSKRKVKRTRTKDANKPPKPQYYYHVCSGQKQVCRLAFKSLHGIKEAKLKSICTLKRLQQDVVPEDGRGKSKFGIIFIDDDIYSL